MFLTPRLYQSHLISVAKEGNSIIVLDTGSGKTLISAFVIRHVLDTAKTGKVCVFIVPTVPLVLQQAEVLQKMFSFRVSQYFGDMGVDYWHMEVKENDVLVMTPMILVNILMHNYVSFEQIGLIVLDECHHARGKSPYNQIVLLYKDRKDTLDEMPRILGLTASPVNNNATVANSIRRNLMCQPVTAQLDHNKEIESHAPKPLEEIALFPTNSSEIRGSLIEQVDKVLLDLPSLHDQIFKRVNEALVEHGLYYANCILRTFIRTLYQKYVIKRDIVDLNILFELDGAFEEDEELEDNELFVRVIEKAHLLILKQPENQLEEGDLSPKIQKLVDILIANKKDDSFCGIVFVQKRITALILSQVLKEHTMTRDSFKVGYLVGHGGTSFKFSRQNQKNNEKMSKFAMMTTASQKETVKQFATGQLNLLVATKVGEEGLDIQPCMLVVRFDPCNTLIDYIQSRGRARHQNSRFVVMCEEGNNAQLFQFEKLRYDEAMTKKSILGLSEGRNAIDDRGTRGLAPVLRENDMYKVEATGATITILNSVGALYNYCSRLPRDEFVDTSPQFQVTHSNGFFCAHIQLPVMVPETCRTIQGPLCQTKDQARGASALEAIRKLHEANELDDRLRVAYVSLKKVAADPEELPEIEPIIPAPAHKLYGTRIPECFQKPWEIGKEVYLYRISVDAFDDFPGGSFGIVTPDRITLESRSSFEFSVDYETGVSVRIKATESANTLILSEEFKKKAGMFHLTVLRALMRSPLLSETTEWGYFMVPLLKREDIAVDEVSLDRVYTMATDKTEANVMSNIRRGKEWFSKDVLVKDPLYYNRTYKVLEVLESATPETPLDEESLSDLLAGVGAREYSVSDSTRFPTVAQFYTKGLGLNEEIDVNQPLLLAQKIKYPAEHLTHVPSRRNRKSKKEEEEEENQREGKQTKLVILLPQSCYLLGVEPEVLDVMGTKIPLVLRSLEHELLVQDFQKHNDLLQVDRKTLRKAFTARNMRFSYDFERPESLGDSFLKMFQSLHLMGTRAEWHEGRLTMARAMMENNEFLRTRGTKKRISEFILAGQYCRKTWVPAYAINGEEEKKKYASHNAKSLTDKAIADCVESIIGCCVDKEGSEGTDKQVLGARAVSRILSEEFKDDLSFYIDGIMKEYKRKEEHPYLKRHQKIKTVTILEKAIGYTFKSPVLAMEALTHASYLDPTWPCGCYQRLEFLGDSIINYLMTRYIYFTFPETTPASITEYRANLISNQFLATVSVSLGLHKLMYASSQEMGIQIASFAEKLAACDRSGRYWIKVGPAPKSVADVFEALVGALYLDTHGDMAFVEDFLRKVAIEPWIGYIGPPNPDAISPISKLVFAIQRHGCREFKFKYFLIDFYAV